MITLIRQKCQTKLGLDRQAGQIYIQRISNKVQYDSNSNLVTQALSLIVTEIQRLIGQKSQILTTPSHLAPSFGVTPFEFMEKLYGF